MKIQLLIPFVVDPQMHKYLREFVPPDVDIVGLKHGPVGETRADAALTLPEELEAMVKAEKDGYDAIVVGCHGDPGEHIRWGGSVLFVRRKAITIIKYGLVFLVSRQKKVLVVWKGHQGEA